MAVLLESLASRGVHVDVLFKRDRALTQPASFGDTIHLEPLPEPFSQPLLRRALPDRLRRFFVRHGRRVVSGAAERTLIGRLGDSGYSLLVGVDPFGITLANRLKERTSAPLAYISFEILFEDELGTSAERALFEMERAACRRTSLVLLPDEERARLFCRERAVSRQQVVIAPVAPAPQRVPRSDDLRGMFGLPASARIVLYCGALERWACSDELGDMVAHWPDRFRLVIHRPPIGNGQMAAVLKRLGKLERVHVSAEPVSRKDLPRLVASADFGLALYKPVPGEWWTGKNIYHLGLSSGKVALYAMCGLPILARSLPVFEREFARYACGEVYREVERTGELLSRMDGRYADYREGALRFYRERLDPVDGINRFCDGLMRLARHQPASG
ncbi:MAG TPA: hypothetical protein VGT40_08130 [Methylomirabilota bacterium]|jgi:hypothetical protein|nr:hypothetical protein [Methylomirabilota bacterium]